METIKVEINLRLSNSFKNTYDTLMSNFNHTIKYEIANKIKGKKLFACYTGFNFYGLVWWQNKKWNCEVWHYKIYQKTYSKNTLEELMLDICDDWGYN